MALLATLEGRLNELEEKIKETRLSLPAHSTKPPVMTALLDLEDERDAILEQIDAIRKKNL